MRARATRRASRPRTWRPACHAHARKGRRRTGQGRPGPCPGRWGRGGPSPPKPSATNARACLTELRTNLQSNKKARSHPGPGFRGALRANGPAGAPACGRATAGRPTVGQVAAGRGWQVPRRRVRVTRKRARPLRRQAHELPRQRPPTARPQQRTAGYRTPAAPAVTEPPKGRLSTDPGAVTRRPGSPAGCQLAAR